MSDSPATFPVHTQLLKNGAFGFMGFSFVWPDTLNADRYLIEGVPLKSWSDLICGWFFL